jgi:hypothetical protein
LINTEGRDVFRRVVDISRDIRHSKEAKEAEEAKQANMNPVHRAFYKTVQKPIGDFFNTFKKEPEEVPFVHDTSGGTNWFNN